MLEFSNVKKVTFNINQEDGAYRKKGSLDIVVFLDDWHPGQFYLYGTSTYSHWRKGECHIFDWANVPHATANASHIPRPSILITGIKTARTEEILNSASADKIYKV